MVERDGLHGFSPANAGLRHQAAGPAHVQAEGEMAVMRPHPRGVIGVLRVQQVDLAEHRVTIDEHLVLHTEIVILQPAGAGDVDEQVRILDQVARRRFTRPVEFAVRAVAINPPVAEAELGHHVAEVMDVVGAILADRLAHRIVGPRARILQVPDVVPQPAEPEQVLDIIPRHAAKGVLAEETGDNDAHMLEAARKVEGGHLFSAFLLKQFLQIGISIFRRRRQGRQSRVIPEIQIGTACD